ncbi:MAG: hypothetical protein QF645_07850 [Planctomycetota bacterium]|jgi:hypothetical protein|nr:hypothetical protein [Planctomycetota bacterium]
MSEKQTEIRKKILEAYRESTLLALSRKEARLYRIAQGVLLALYAAGVIFLETILEKNAIETSLADRIVGIVLVTGILIGIRIWLERRTIIRTFRGKYESEWGLVEFYRENWTYLRYLVFRDTFKEKIQTDLSEEKMFEIRDHFSAEADLLSRTHGIGFAAKYAGYAIGLMIAIFSKMAMKFTHPVMLNTLIVLASLLIFTNVLQRQFRSQTQKLEEVRQLWNWYIFEHKKSN